MQEGTRRLARREDPADAYVPGGSELRHCKNGPMGRPHEREVPSGQTIHGTVLERWGISPSRATMGRTNPADRQERG